MNSLIANICKKKYQTFGIFVFIVLVIRALQHHPFLEIDPWLYSHYLFNYNELEFIKRGLISTIFNINPQNYIIRANIVCWLIILVTCYQFSVFLDKSKSDFKVILFVFFISGFALQNLSFDFGRFDIIGILIFLLYLNYNKYSKILFILSPLLLFVHEVQLFLTLSFIGLHFFIRSNFRFNLIILIFIFQIVIFLLILFLFGKYEGEEIQYIEYFSIINYFGSDVILSSLNNTILTTLKTMIDPINLILRYPALMLTIFFMIIIFKKVNYPKNNEFKTYYFLTCFFYLILFLIGGDYSRWLSIFYIMNLLLLSDINNLSNYKSSLNYFILIEKKVVYFFLFFVFTGPVGVGHFLDILLRYSYKIYKLLIY